jgi:hypothetical protein
VEERVLAWEGNVDTNTCMDEDVTILMEPSKGILKAVEVLSGYCVTTSDVAKVKECGDAFDHIHRDVSDDCSKINLYIGSMVQQIAMKTEDDN